MKDAPKLRRKDMLTFASIVRREEQPRDAVSRYVYTALQGGTIMKGRTNDDRIMIACCNDGTRPVIFKIERIITDRKEILKELREVRDTLAGSEELEKEQERSTASCNSSPFAS